MIKLFLNIGRSYDGYGEQIAKKEEIVLTKTEAESYLTEFIESMGIEKTKEWLKMAKHGEIK
jgi:hypothetical protein